MRSDIQPGATFPDYELPDHTDTPRKLSELQGRDPLILTLARGHYCPKEHQQHLDLAAFQPKIAVAYTQIVTISTDEHHTLQEFRLSVGAQWTFLSDPERTVQRDLDIKEYTDPDHDPMIPHTLVLKPGLVVHPDSARHGTPATSRRSTDGTSGPTSSLPRREGRSAGVRGDRVDGECVQLRLVPPRVIAARGTGVRRAAQSGNRGPIVRRYRLQYSYILR